MKPRIGGTRDALPDLPPGVVYEACVIAAHHCASTKPVNRFPIERLVAGVIYVNSQTAISYNKRFQCE